MSSDNLLVGDEFDRDGITWVVTADEGSGQVFPDHVRMVCEPKPAA